MNQTKDLSIKCQIEHHHNNLQLACFNESCIANRVYCHECLRNGDHVAHMKDQLDLKDLINFFEQISEENDGFLKKINKQIEKINQKAYQLSQGLRKKYSLSFAKLQQLDAKQLNQAFNKIIEYRKILKTMVGEIEECINHLIIQLNQQIKGLQLEELQYCELTHQKITEVEEYFRKGQILKNEYKYEEAISYFDKALSLNPKHLLSLHEKSESLGFMENYHDAIYWANKALSIDSNHVDSLQTKADSLKFCGNYQEAIKLAEKALSINSNHVNSLQTIASSLKSLGKYDDAIKWAQKSVQLDPRNYKSLQIIAGCLRTLGKYNEAVLYADKALKINPKHLASLYTKGESLRMQGHFQQAITTLDDALKINPLDSQCLASKGACLEAQFRYSDAIDHYNRALQQDSNYMWALQMKVECEKKLRRQSAIL
ncbi:unnamed protein product [Paramecium sonneborni]|uniref:Tetratricopeptide repeat protein n=1 Tax=Paramecium sonneborni TaxID=65129 RepID=A0A8S1NBR2_9CILI|nr:unnamed protein product [Paramecium sonneborni]